MGSVWVCVGVIWGSELPLVGGVGEVGGRERQRATALHSFAGWVLAGGRGLGGWGGEWARAGM